MTQLCKNITINNMNIIATTPLYGDDPKIFEGVSTLNNCSINNQSIINNAFKKITNINNFTIGNDVTSVASMFEGNTNLISDFIIPSHITNCTNTFKGCTSMTHIHSNWHNVYDNEITTTDCYAGCTGITHCDGIDLGVNEYIKGLDEVPLAWGGYEFTKATTGIYEVVIPSDNYTVSFGYSGGGYSAPVFIKEGTIDWGDGTVTTKEDFTTEGYYAPHTYSKAGTYIIKGKTVLGNSLGETSTEMKNTLTRILQYPNNYPCFSMCKNCNKLTYVNATGWKLYNSRSGGNLNSMFQGCSKLTVIEGTNTWDTSNANNMLSMFDGCSNLTSLDLSGWNVSKVTNMTNMFQGTSKLNNLTLNWDLSNVLDLSQMFQGTGLSKIEGITFSEEPPSNYTNANYRRSIANFVRECPNLTSINIDLRGFCRHDEMFRGSPNISYIKSIDFTYDILNNVNLAWNTKFANMTDLNITGTISVSIPNGFNNMPNLTVKCLTDIINALADLSGSDSKKCYLGATNLAKLSSNVIAIATNKNWTVV